MALSTNIDNLGSVAFAQSPRARYLRITIKADKTIKVTIPRNGSLNEAKRFLRSKAAWVQRQLQKK